MKRIILLKGLPASGKTTWALEHVARNPGRYVRSNKDELRRMLHGGRHSRANEREVLAVRDFIIEHGLRTGRTVIVDDTNLNPVHERRIREIAQAHGAEVEVKTFDVPVDECIARDAARAEPVGAAAILDMWSRYVAPAQLEPYAPPRPGLPSCIICDLDGTLALLDGRDPFDQARCEQDRCNEPVAEILRTTAHAVVIVSGRFDTVRPETERWLARHRIPYAALLMRTAGDRRDDAVVKRELFEAHIRERWHPVLVFDDRPKVIRMWRSLGLLVADVGTGREF